GERVSAWDTGAGSALIDDHMSRTMNQRFDKDGEFAAKGRVDQAWVSSALKLPFFSLKPPKSLDRNDFAGLKVTDMAPADGAATLTAFTAAAIARIVPQLPKWPNSWIICGGGARKRTLMEKLSERRQAAPSRGGRERRQAAGAVGGGGGAGGGGFWLLARRRREGVPRELSRHNRRAHAHDRRGDRAAVNSMQMHRP